VTDRRPSSRYEWRRKITKPNQTKPHYRLICLLFVSVFIGLIVGNWCFVRFHNEHTCCCASHFPKKLIVCLLTLPMQRHILPASDAALIAQSTRFKMQFQIFWHVLDSILHLEVNSNPKICNEPGKAVICAFKFNLPKR
jgi:hypothetical protein